MSQQSLEYRTVGTAAVAGSSGKIAVCLLGAFVALVIPINIWLYYQGTDKMDVIAEAIVIYIFSPIANAFCGIVLLACALRIRKRRGRSGAVTACLVAAAAVPLIAMFIEGIVISAAFH